MAMVRPKGKGVIRRYAPIVDWLPLYDWKGDLRPDLVAGLTVWALLVPEAMAYAGIAGVPPEAGLYAAPLALLGYAMFGSSRHLFVGPSSTVAILSATVVGGVAAADGSDFWILTAWLAIVTGILFVLFGLARMGWVANFMAASVIDGFMVGLAIVIAVGQLDKIFGIEAEGSNAVVELGSMVVQIPAWSLPTIAVGTLSLAALFVIERFWPRLPAALLVLFVAIAASAAFDFESHGIHIVGEIPAGLPTFGFPTWVGWGTIVALVPGALAVILVGYAESYGAAKSYASRFGYQVDPNQEMIGLGVANFGAGFSQGFVVDGSLSKTAAGVGAGQKSQMTSVFCAVFVLITIVALTWLFEPLPEAVLGAIVIHAVWKLIDFSKFTKLWKIRHIDFALAIAAFLGVVLIDILQGIIIGIVLSLLALIYRASFPEGSELGRLETDDGVHEFVGVDANPDAETLTGLVIYRQTGSLIFSNAEAFSTEARELLWKRTDPPAVLLVVDCEQIADLDVSGAEEILSLFEELQEADVDMWLTRLHGDALITAQKAGVIDELGEERVHPTIRVAGDMFRARYPELGQPIAGRE